MSFGCSSCGRLKNLMCILAKKYLLLSPVLSRTKEMHFLALIHNSSLFNEFVCKLGFFGTCTKKAQFTHERVLFAEPLKGSKSLKIFKISLTFRFDRL
jgi:hypothetical protein